MDENIIKRRFQRWIVVVSITLMVGKFVSFWLTNSIGIFTDAMESIVNVVAGFMSLMALRWAAKPRDRKHPFGHGKIELVSASVEGIMIAAAGCFIIYEGFYRLTAEVVIERLDIGIWVVAFAGLVNWIAGGYSIRMGRKYNSVALVASGRHLQSDTYSTIGLVVGLLVVYFTGMVWLDGALAMTFGLIILLTGISILRNTLASLLDTADQQLISQVVELIKDKREREWITIHNTRMIKSGSLIYMDCDLTLPWYYNISQSHDCCDRLSEVLVGGYGERVQILVHSDPCDQRFCSLCSVDECPYRKASFLRALDITVDSILDNDQQLLERIETLD